MDDHIIAALRAGIEEVKMNKDVQEDLNALIGILHRRLVMAAPKLPEVAALAAPELPSEPALAALAAAAELPPEVPEPALAVAAKPEIPPFDFHKSISVASYFAPNQVPLIVTFTTAMCEEFMKTDQRWFADAFKHMSAKPGCPLILRDIDKKTIWGFARLGCWDDATGAAFRPQLPGEIQIYSKPEMNNYRYYIQPGSFMNYSDYDYDHYTFDEFIDDCMDEGDNTNIIAPFLYMNCSSFVSVRYTGKNIAGFVDRLKWCFDL